MSHDATPQDRPEEGFADALRRAVAERGVTLSWLQKRLRDHGNRVSMATLSYWRSGARRPEGAQSIAAIADIEQLLGLDAGALTALIGPTVRTGPLGAPQFPLEVARLESAVSETFAALDAPLPETSRDVSSHAITEVGADGSVLSRTTRTLVQATSGTVTEVPYLELTPGVPTPPPIFRPIAGGRIVRRHSHPSGEVHGVSFELERPLHPAQTAMLEWALEYPPGYPPSQETGHGVARQSREILLWTRFHPDALPDWIEEMEDTPSGTVYTPLSLDGGTSIHQVRRGFGPGMLALRWGDGEPPEH